MQTTYERRRKKEKETQEEIYRIKINADKKIKRNVYFVRNCPKVSRYRKNVFNVTAVT